MELVNLSFGCQFRDRDCLSTAISVAPKIALA
jgi:hypothetical protein